MKRLACLVAIFAVGLGAQSLEFFQVAPQITQHQWIGGSYLGVSLAEVDSKRAAELKLKEPYGVEISRVEDGSPADKAGLKSGDVVIEYNGEHVEGMEQFGRLVHETPAGREARLQINRNGAAQTIVATLGTRKLRPPVAGTFGPGFEIPEIRMPDMPQIFTTLRSPLLGVEAESLGPQLAVYFGVKQGVLVRSVLKNTAAEKAGIKAGDVITGVDGSGVNTPSELSNLVRISSSKKTFPIEMTRDHKELSINVTVDEARNDRPIPSGRVVRNGVK